MDRLVYGTVGLSPFGCDFGNIVFISNGWIGVIEKLIID